MKSSWLYSSLEFSFLTRMTRCPPICGKKKQEGEKKEVKKAKKDEDEEVLRKLVTAARG